MFEKVTPEAVGISSKNVEKYVRLFERYELPIHSVVMLRHGKIFYENHWKPFHGDYLHRVYSITKSFVGIAVGFLVQDGLVDLDAPAVSYFDEEKTKNAGAYVKKQTVRNMLMMCTGGTCKVSHFFAEKPADRLKHYFDRSAPEYGGVSKLPGTMFDYDSTGSFILGALVEVVSGKSLNEYLREKLFDKIGVSEGVYFLQSPGGHTWADSSLICTAMDLAKTMQFLLNGGKWNGEQLLDADYVKDATSNLIPSDEIGYLQLDSYGYGYQIWKAAHDGFAFQGLGKMYALAVPEKDMILVVTGYCQGNAIAGNIIMDRFFEEIEETATDNPLPEDKDAFNSLMKYSEGCELYCLSNSFEDNVASEVSGKEFIMDKNPMGISKMKFTFADDVCKWEYTNAQGDKTLYFGINKNIDGIFPQEGYSDMVGNEYAKGNYYKCTSSAAWTHKRNLKILVQVIDKYFGRLFMRVTFTENGEVAVMMHKDSENFMNEYCGYAEGKLA